MADEKAMREAADELILTIHGLCISQLLGCYARSRGKGNVGEMIAEAASKVRQILETQAEGRGNFGAGMLESYSIERLHSEITTIARRARLASLMTLYWQHHRSPDAEVWEQDAVFGAWLVRLGVPVPVTSGLETQVGAGYVFIANEQFRASGQDFEAWFDSLMESDAQWMKVATEHFRAAGREGPSTPAEENTRRILYYQQILQDVADPEKLGDRLYAVLSEVVSKDAVLPFIETEWASLEKSFRVILRQGAAKHEPALFGKDAFWRRVDIECDAWLERAKQRTIECWRSNGRLCENAVDYVKNQERAFLRIALVLARHPLSSEAQLRDHLDESLLRSLEESGSKVTKEDLFEFANIFLQPPAIAEGKRRFDASIVGREIRTVLG